MRRTILFGLAALAATLAPAVAGAQRSMPAAGAQSGQAPAPPPPPAVIEGAEAPAGAALALPPAETPAGPAVELSLDEALDLAAGESEQVWIAEAGVDRAEGGRLVARSERFPQVSGTADYTRTLRSQFQDLQFGDVGGGGDGEGGEQGDSGLGDLPFGRPNQFSLGLSVLQVLFNGGQTAARNRAAAARRRVAELGLGAARAQALLDVAEGYYDAVLADSLVGIAELALAQTEEILRQTDVARRVGASSEFDLLRARVARDNQVPTVLQRRNERDLAYLQLRQLLNLPPDLPLRLTTPVEQGSDRFAGATGATATVLRPDARVAVREASEAIAVSEAQVAETRGQRLPTVALSSRYAPVAYPESGLPDPDDFREDWTVSLGLSVPLLTWGRQRGNEIIARSGLDEARARFVQTREAAALEARVAGRLLALAEATLASTESTAREAERAYQIAVLRFQEGISSQLELTDARLLLEQAATNRARVLRDLQVARARLALLPDLPLTGSALAAASASVTAATSPSGAGGAASSGFAPGGASGAGGGTSAGIPIPGLAGGGGPIP
jgi:outer membrane protein